MKSISEKKLKAFTVGNMGKASLSKKELEELKKKEDEEAAAHVFKEFVETFQEVPTPSSKVWVKAGTYDAGSRREDNREKGKLYKPSSKLEEKTAAEKAQEYAKMLASELKKDALPLKKKNQEKKKSNLELFKEELRQIQEEREERHKYKHMAGQAVTQQQQQQQQQPQTQQIAQAQSETPAETPNQSDGREAGGSFDNGDPNTTNLYLGNLSPKISEQQLMEIFGRYGPLASIKIMWPRSEEEKQRGRNCGFVAYMSRKDAERALKALHGRYIMGHDMRLGWGKAVPVLNQPIFVPAPLLELTMPPPPSGLPFNAQPPPNEGHILPFKHYKELATPEEKENMERILQQSTVKVLIPTEKSVLNIIHRMIEFVIREGPVFEALIMRREKDNPVFSFLFDNESPAHIYYRWKLFSLLQGDTPSEWSEKEFRMFKGGPIWRPPIANFYTQGMPDEMVIDPEAPEVHKGALSTAQRDRLEDIIHYLTPERSRIGDAMIFCIEHADAADEICETIAESLANSNTLASKKIARLYLLSDILHNCTVKVANASFFRKAIEKNLIEIFENMHVYFTSYESRLKAEGLKSRVITVLNTWEEWAVYPKEFLTQLKSIFLGKQWTAPEPEEPKQEEIEDIDGAPLSGDERDDEDLDGVPLDGAALLKGVLMRVMPESKSATPRGIEAQRETNVDFDDDIDGIPLDDDIDGIPIEKLPSDIGDFSLKPMGKAGAFIPSKWETVDPEQVEAQAITTSKWDTLDPPEPPKIGQEYSSDDETNSQSYDEEKRLKLREIELKTMQYQDELDAGDRELKPGWSVSEQVEHYRKKLLKKTARAEMVDSPLSYSNTKDSRRSGSPENIKAIRRNRRSTSSSRASPVRIGRKRSRSPYSVRKEISPSSSSRSGKSARRNRSRSLSDSPKRQLERATQSSKVTKYDSPVSRSRRSPSPSSYSGRSSRRDERELHKHKHKHKGL